MNNRQWVLRARPSDQQRLADCFERVDKPLRAITQGEVLLRNLVFGVEPGMKTWMVNQAPYMAPIELGEPMHCWCVAEVIESKNPRLAVGQRVQGVFDWQEYCICGDLDLNATRMFVVPPDASNEAASGLLWVSGVTAYVGLMEYAQPKQGDTVLVTAAGGAVGSTVGQLAKLAGARVVGMAGSADKCQRLIDELGFDAAVNYKSPDLAQQLRIQCPDGVNVYWDAVGGSLLDTVLLQMALNGRIVQVGAMSLMEKGLHAIEPLRNWFMPVAMRLTWRGLLITDHWDKFDSVIARLHRLHKAGQLKLVIHTMRGFDELPGALENLSSGQNFGKMIVLMDS